MIAHNWNGLLVESNNPDKLAESILVLLNDPGLAEKFGQNGRIFIEQHFELKRMVNEMESIYETLCPKQ